MMACMYKRIVAVVLLGTASAAALGAAQLRYLPDAPGRWKPWRFEAFEDSRRVSAAKPAEVKAVEAQLVALNAILRRAPGFDAPIGFSVETVGSLDIESRRQGQPAGATLPLPFTVNFGAYAIHTSEQGGATRRDDTGETAQLLFFVNHLALALLFEAGGVPEFDALETDVTRLATSQPGEFGMRRHGDALVLKRNPAPLSTAVSLEESLQLLTRTVAARLATAREAAARVQKQYDDARDPVKRAQRLAEYKRLAPMVKDPAYVDKMIKADQGIETGLATMVGPTSPTARNVAAVESDLAAVKVALGALPGRRSRRGILLRRPEPDRGGAIQTGARARLRANRPAELEAVQPRVAALGATDTRDRPLRALSRRPATAGVQSRRVRGQPEAAGGGRQAGAPGVAAVIMHGAKDSIVPAATSRRAVAALQAVGVPGSSRPHSHVKE